MGFVLSIFYFIVSYLTPAAIFGPLAQYRIELILAVLILLVSLPKVIGSVILKTPQSLALIGLAIAAFFSVLVGQHWAGGGVGAFLGFIPSIYFYFLACLHCTTRKRLQVLVLMLLFVCLFVTAHGVFDLLHNAHEGDPSFSGETGNLDVGLWNSEHPYVYAMASDSGELFYRLRGLGMINDPNDFGQLIVCVVPLMFLFWRPNKMAWNIPFVILPVCVLVTSVFLTHSRGALLALTAEASVAARRRIGVMPAALLACILFAAAMALHFTGGRDISASAGEDRTGLWGEGLAVFRAHPLFGIGYGELGNYTESHLTAHNSVVLCAAELGLFGLYFWSLFLFPTVRDALVIGSAKSVNQGEPLEPEEPPFPHPVLEIEQLEKAEINRAGNLLLISLVGFFVTAWFLSRAFAITLFLLGGMTEAVYQMVQQRGMIAPRLPFVRVLTYSAGLAGGLLIVVYTMVRVANFMR
jgi:O-antigen ligase